MPEMQTPKWTEIEHLPEWDEEFYDVYTAKKYGKWLMLKTLKPEYRDIVRLERNIRRDILCPSISRRTEDFMFRFVLRKPPRNRMLTSAAANNQDLHVCTSCFLNI